MIRKSHLLALALALAAAAVAAPIAQASSAPKVDPLAVSYLIGQGLSPSEVTSWTTGACSQQVKAASCYAMFKQTAAPKPVDPLAVSYLTGQGLSPSEVTSWTTAPARSRSRTPRASRCSSPPRRLPRRSFARSASSGATPASAPGSPSEPSSSSEAWAPVCSFHARTAAGRRTREPRSS